MNPYSFQSDGIGPAEPHAARVPWPVKLHIGYMHKLASADRSPDAICRHALAVLRHYHGGFLGIIWWNIRQRLHTAECDLFCWWFEFKLWWREGWPAVKAWRNETDEFSELLRRTARERK